MKVVLNPMFEEARGQLGDLVFRELRGKTIVSRKSTGSVIASEDQSSHRARFRQAAAYGKAALANPATREMYEELAKSKDIPVFAATIADFFNAPVIQAVDLSAYNGQAGDLITISAHDDFGVALVHVSITDDGGSLIENGDAVPGAGGWIYTASQVISEVSTVHIQVVATDRPGGATVASATKSF